MELDTLITRRHNNAPFLRRPAPPRLPFARLPTALIRAAGVRDRQQRPHLVRPGDGDDLATLGPGEDGDAVGVLGLGVAERGGDFAPAGRPD